MKQILREFDVDWKRWYAAADVDALQDYCRLEDVGLMIPLGLSALLFWSLSPSVRAEETIHFRTYVAQALRRFFWRMLNESWTRLLNARSMLGAELSEIMSTYGPRLRWPVIKISSWLAKMLEQRKNTAKQIDWSLQVCWTMMQRHAQRLKRLILQRADMQKLALGWGLFEWRRLLATRSSISSYDQCRRGRNPKRKYHS